MADIQGNGQLAVVEGTVTGGATGSVYALNATTGAVIWHDQRTPAARVRVGHDCRTRDRIPGRHRADRPWALHPRRPERRRRSPTSTTGRATTQNPDLSGKTFGFQNAALVTGDPLGAIGITVAGYFGIGGGDVQGIVQHFEVAGLQRGARGRVRWVAPVPSRLGADAGSSAAASTSGTVRTARRRASTATSLSRPTAASSPSGKTSAGARAAWC